MARESGATPYDPSIFREGNPWRLVVDLNEACNIQCSYCHIDALYGARAKNARTLPTETVNSLMQDADQMQVFDITLTGGEITIMPDFLDYLRPVRDLRFSSVQMISNGTRITQQLAEQLVDAGMQRVSISIDGPEDANDHARGSGVWKRAWRGVENAVAAGLKVNVISVLGKHNLDNWHELPIRLKNAGVRSQNVSLMCRLGRAEAAEEWMGVPAERLDEVREKVRELQSSLNDDTFAMFLNDGVMKQPGWSGEPTPLHAFQDQNPGIEAVIKVDGRVLRNRLYGKDRDVGNLNQMRLAELWEQDRPNRRRLITVVGAANEGALPALYYHYGTHTDQKFKGPFHAEASSQIAHDGDIRVREEQWGRITFDRRTFSITNIEFKERMDE